MTMVIELGPSLLRKTFVLVLSPNVATIGTTRVSAPGNNLGTGGLSPSGQLSLFKGRD
jgi:hypothetical protein